MNAIPRHLSVHTAPSAAMARDLLGRAGPSPSAVTYHARLSSLDTRGPLSLVDSTVPAGTAVAPHRHPAEDEIVIVLSGEVELRLGKRTLRRGPGTSTFIPRGTEHGLSALTEARTIAILTRESIEIPPAL